MDGIHAYFQLVRERPDLFRQSERVPLILEEGAMRAFARSQHREMGLVYDNRPYYMLLADLCGSAGREFAYCRVVYPQQGSNGVVVIARREDRFALLSIFRHGTRRESLEFCRGFADPGASPEENVRREVREELGGEVLSLSCLGEVQADSGLCSGSVQVYTAEVGPCARMDTEGIHGLRWVTEPELRQLIADGAITDSFTLSAYARLLCSGAALPERR